MIPRLIHPVPVVVRQVNAEATVIDPVFEQPVGAVAHREYRLSGQVSTARGDNVSMTRAGRSDVSTAAGHIVFELAALARAGVELHQGDMIVSVGGAEVAYRILRLEQHAVYAGRAWHLWAFFNPETQS